MISINTYSENILSFEAEAGSKLTCLSTVTKWRLEGFGFPNTAARIVFHFRWKNEIVSGQLSKSYAIKFWIPGAFQSNIWGAQQGYLGSLQQMGRWGTKSSTVSSAPGTVKDSRFLLIPQGSHFFFFFFFSLLSKATSNRAICKTKMGLAHWKDVIKLGSKTSDAALGFPRYHGDVSTTRFSLDVSLFRGWRESRIDLVLRPCAGAQKSRIWSGGTPPDRMVSLNSGPASAFCKPCLSSRWRSTWPSSFTSFKPTKSFSFMFLNRFFFANSILLTMPRSPNNSSAKQLRITFDNFTYTREIIKSLWRSLVT